MTAQQQEDIADEARAVCIAEQNDKFRQHVLKCFGMAPSDIPGLLVQTRSVADMGIAELAQLYAAVHGFSDFDAEENDPHGEHDFGRVEIAGEKFFLEDRLLCR